MIRKLKLTYMVYNWFQKAALEHNLRLYREIGLKKRYFAPVSSKDFVNVDPNLIRKKGPEKRLESTRLFSELSKEGQESLRKFQEEGFAILPGFLSSGVVDRINSTIQTLQEVGKVRFRYGNKIMFAIEKSTFLKELWVDEKILELLSVLIGGEAKLFQSINFVNTGSQQKTHSDSIHMTTFPLGGLLGVWVALEDVDEENGPLHYYPGSHKLPYYLNSDYDNEGNWWFIGKKGYGEYEKMLAQKIAEHQIQKKIFKAKKGDLLIWHANLLHGGESQLNKNRTRKSMVLHYFDVHRICYHELTQRPALIQNP